MLNATLLKTHAQNTIKSSWMKFILLGVFIYMINLCFVQLLFNIETEMYSIRLFGVTVFSMDLFEGYDFVIKFGLAKIIYTILIAYPFEYGIYVFCKNVFYKKEKMKNIFAAFKKGYSKILSVMLIKDMITAMYLLFFIIPGIMKYYDYRLVPYLLHDYPDLEAHEVLAKSKEMMRGYRMFMFMLDCSFIIWTILGLYTMDLSTIYSTPLYYLTKTQVYLVLSKQMQIKAVNR